MLRDPVSINLERESKPAVGITHAVYPVPQELKSALFLTLLQRNEMQEALVFTRTKHRADRLTKYLVQHGIAAERIHGNRSQPQRTQALAGFKSGKYRVLVATDIAARGIDIEALGHVVNFDVPKVPEDYIHRVGRTARAEAVGDAFTFVAPDEEAVLRSIERVMGKRLPRVIVPDFDYAAKTGGILEIPLADRIAAIRAKKKDDRARSAAKAQRRTEAETAEKARRDGQRPSPPAGAGSSRRRRPRSRTRRPGSGGSR
jgi:ATP-dependent RNA helicase RhlE